MIGEKDVPKVIAQGVLDVNGIVGDRPSTKKEIIVDN